MTSASAARRLLLARQKFKRAETIWAKGFTLIEVVIVAAIAGVLGATAIPQFIGTKDRAEQRAVVAEAVGLAKECATGFVEGVEQLVTTPATGNDVTCGTGTAKVVTSSTFTTGAVTCADTTMGAAVDQVSITISTDGSIDCGQG